MSTREKTTTLVLQLSGDVYLKLREEAERLGKPLELAVQEWLAERVDALPATILTGKKSVECYVMRAFWSN